MGLTGDFAGLADLASRLESLPTIFSDLSEEGAKKAVWELRKGFSKGTDPYGAGWAPQKRAYGNPLMRRTRRLMRSVKKINVTTRGFSVTYGTGYGQYHQRGTTHSRGRSGGGLVKMVARKIIPDDAIPPKWVKFLEKTAADLMEALLG